ncbi:RNA polymerase sigma factor [Paenibacillus tarimensis]
MPASAHYETIVKPHLKELYKYCLYLSGSRWDGEDLYQESLLKSLHYYSNSGEISNAKPFLFRVAKNLWVDEYRSRKRKQPLALLKDMDYTDASDMEVSVVIEWLAARLPARHMEVWLMAEYFGFTMNEIADRLQMTMPAVRSILHRSRSKLRKYRIESLYCPQRRQSGSGKVRELRIEHWVRCIARDNPRPL